VPFLIRLVLAIGAALVLGLGSAYYTVRAGLSGGEIANGPWRTSLVTGSQQADLYTRARVAVGGLLALAPSETVYWNADVDAEGRALDARCDYRIEGEELPARWWSVTAYGADHFLIPNDAGRHSFSQTTLARAPGGRWTMTVSTEKKPDASGARSEAEPSEVINWLPSGRSGAAGPFALTLRLYNPEPEVVERAGAVRLPRIERESCR
jgi:hypothetical protein